MYMQLLQYLLIVSMYVSVGLCIGNVLYICAVYLMNMHYMEICIRNVCFCNVIYKRPYDCVYSLDKSSLQLESIQ